MLVTIDTDQLVRDAATTMMDTQYAGEWRHIVDALQRQLNSEGVYVPIHIQVRNQVKEYKKLTMWKD